MTKSQIDCFLSVYRTRSFTKAANMLYISQPAISQSVSKLEEELGFSLFRRAGSTLHVTEGGRRFYTFIENARQEYEDMLADVRRDERRGGVLRVGCPETWDPRRFTGLIAEPLSQARPEIRLEVEARKLSELIVALQSGDIDVAVTHGFFTPAIYGLVTRRICDTGCGVLYSRERFGEVHRMEELRDAAFLLFDDDITRRFTGLIRDICARHGFRPEVRTFDRLPTALFAAARGEGVMLFSDWDSAARNGSFGYLRLPERLPVVMMLFPENAPETVELFVRESVRLAGGARIDEENGAR